MTAQRAASADGGTDVLRFENVRVTYGSGTASRDAVRGVSFTVARGETVGIVGESGSGKSTLAYTAIGYVASGGRVSEGAVRFDGQDLLSMDEAALRRLRGTSIAMVYQDPTESLNPAMRLGDQVVEVLRAHTSMSRPAAKRRTLELFDLVKLPDPATLARRYPHQVSGGQLQRVVIAMGVACNPELLIMDEPTTGLDVTTELHILELIGELREQLGMAIVYISHDLNVVARVADRVVVMYAGEIVEVASATTVFEAARHPYTVGLLASTPRLDDRSSTTIRIPWARHQQLAVSGCQFASRCWFVDEECKNVAPTLTAIDSGSHLVRCHHRDELRSSHYDDVRVNRRDPPPADPAVAPLLEVRGLSKSYQVRGFLSRRSTSVEALVAADLEIRPGESLAVVGESGSGKTTLAKCIMAMEVADSGALTLKGQPLPLDGKHRSSAQRRAVQMIFQNPNASLNPAHTVFQSLSRPIKLFSRLDDRRDVRDAAAELLDSVRLDASYLERHPSQLSGGEKQRVAIARAIAGAPELVVCDEPVSSLDVSVQAAIMDLLLELQEKRRFAYLFISHDLALVRRFANRVMVMYRGREVESGTVDEVFSPPHHDYTRELLTAASRTHRQTTRYATAGT